MATELRLHLWESSKWKIVMLNRIYPSGIPRPEVFWDTDRALIRISGQLRIQPWLVGEYN